MKAMGILLLALAMMGCVPIIYPARYEKPSRQNLTDAVPAFIEAIQPAVVCGEFTPPALSGIHSCGRPLRARKMHFCRASSFIVIPRQTEGEAGSFAEATPNLRNKLRRCASAVRGLIASALAISLLVLPAST